MSLAAKTEGAETSSQPSNIEHDHLLDEDFLRGVRKGLVAEGHGEEGEGGLMTIVTDNGAYIELLAGEVLAMRKDGIFKAAATASAADEYWGKSTTTREGGGIVSSGMPQVRTTSTSTVCTTTRSTLLVSSLLAWLSVHRPICI
jgi:hypothetical protein